MGDPGHHQLGPVLRALCNRGDLTPPRKDQEAPGILNHDCQQGKETGGSFYDTQFRQQITSFDTADFSRLNQSLYAITFLVYGGDGRQKVCPDSMMLDHAYKECTLYPNRTAPFLRMQEVGGRQQRGQEVRRKWERAGPCFVWNEGWCAFTRCRYEHVCSQCAGDHKKDQCRDGPGERREQGQGGHGQ